MTRPLLLLLGLLSVAAAEDLTTTDGKTYTAVTITKVEPDGLRILHASGTAMVPFAKLPEDLQKKYNYDPAKAQARAKEEAAKLAEARRAAKEKQQANEWHSKFQIVPLEQDRITISYSSPEDEIRSMKDYAVRFKLSKQDAESSIKSAAKGGYISAIREAPTTDEAESHTLAIMLFDHAGNEIKMDPFQSVAGVTRPGHGPWFKRTSVKLLGPLEPGDRIRIIDKFDNRHRDFVVKAKEAISPQPATP